MEIKMNLFENLESILFEDIYGNKAIVYHRTQVEDLINKVYTSGFKPGFGNLYGDGFYSTYELESQLKQKMKSYGDIIVKFMINSLNRFLILDYSEFIKSPVSKKINTNQNDFIYDQMKYFNFDQFSKFKKDNFNQKQESSDIAYLIYSKYITVIDKFIDGIIFTGRQDGKVLVCYNTDLIIPLSFSQDEGKTWKKVDKNLDYLKKVFSINSDELKIKKREDIEKQHWINKAKISDDSLYVIDFHITDLQIQFIWVKGIWHNGVWKNGTWQDGIWENGTWENGKFKNSTWEKGIWKFGHFYNGIWKDGTWENGVFEGRIWENGTWNNGVWRKGTWKNGTWIKGLWKEGTWLGGYDGDGNYHPKGDSPDKWSKE
jgi:hypothetical protein